MSGMAQYLKEEKTEVVPRIRGQREKRGWTQDELDRFHAALAENGRNGKKEKGCSSPNSPHGPFGGVFSLQTKNLVPVEIQGSAEGGT